MALHCRFVVATLGPRPNPEQRETLARHCNTVLTESDFRLEWMEGGRQERRGELQMA